MVVIPPAAAALVAELIVSLCSEPGSPVETERSIMPGHKTNLLHSIISTSL